jgi:hypothetical protein
MYALIWIHRYWALWEVIFNGKSQLILLVNLLCIMQYVNCILHNVCTIMDAYKYKYTLGLVGVIFNGKSQPILLKNLLIQNAIYLMQYVNCMMHNVCTHMDAYKKICTLICLVGCNLLWEKSTNIINEFTQPKFNMLINAYGMHNAQCIMYA